MAEELVDYFATVADGIGGQAANLRSVDDFTNHSSVQRIQQEHRSSEGVLEIKPVTQKEVLRVLESLDVNKATGNDGIPPKVLKSGAEELSSSLTTLFNSCINKSVWPSQWKSGDWVPIYKKDDKMARENYRPITLLPCASKVLEKLVGVQVNFGFDDRIYLHSSAYRKAHSCETTLINLVENWRLARDQGKVVSILSTDMSKAFDSLHPPLLLSKFRAYGFRENTVQLLNSYLTDRKYRVKIGRHVSSSRLVNRGCPQGSALGPLLWNVFQNDLPYGLNAKLSMYADDHQIYHIGDDQEAVTSQLMESVNYVTNWYGSNLLAGNIKKYQAMNIGFSQSNGNIHVNGEEIKTADNLQLLGVTLDSDLSFSDHINLSCKKASQRIGVLMRLRNLIPTQSKLILFKCAILPYVTYCHLVWHFCKASDTRKLERIQERGLRAVFKDNSSRYNQLLARAGLPTLHNRRLQDLSILMYKVKHKLCPYYLCDFFSNNSSKYNLRQSDFTMPRFNSVKYGKHSIRYLGPKLWSKLPKSIREAASLSAFKTKIRNLNNLDALLDDGCRGCPLCSS